MSSKVGLIFYDIKFSYGFNLVLKGLKGIVSINIWFNGFNWNNNDNRVNSF